MEQGKVAAGAGVGREKRELAGSARFSLTLARGGRTVFTRVIETCSAPTPGSPGRGAGTPGGGEVLFGELRGSPRSTLRGAGDGFGACTGVGQARGRKSPPRAGTSRGEGTPGGGAKPKGGSSPTAPSGGRGQRTSAEGNARKAGEDLHGSGRRVRLSQRHAGWVGREVRPVPRKGNPSKGKSQERYRLKHGGRFRGEQGVKRVQTLKTQRNRAG